MSRFVDLTEYFGKGQPFPKILIAKDMVVDIIVVEEEISDKEVHYRVGVSVVNRPEPLFTVDSFKILGDALDIAEHFKNVLS